MMDARLQSQPTNDFTAGEADDVVSYRARARWPLAA